MAGRPMTASPANSLAERLSRRGFYLPSGLGLKENEIDRVAEALREALL